ncbi:DUF3300 domain-containing protein [Comamonas sediminis]|uniref:DUF3300 domain-containing protein n=1 Tax=Comamonas sediminis TaxID=1783360 RepID=A0ABV4AZE3_9BURK
MFHAVDRLDPVHSPVLPPRLLAAGFRTGLVALAAALALAGCNDDGDAHKAASASAENAAANPAPAAQPAEVQAAYTPPSADILYQMVAPIALYPDKLVAQILAGSTYPDQVSAAEAWLAQNPGLKAGALSNAAHTQPWDPSIKSLTLFPNVLGQMASNLPWTTALGKAYYNDPADVMNAIQVMRGRAYKAGSLKDSSHLKVKLVTDAAPPKSYTPSDAAPEVLVSAPVIEPPQQFIEIAPAEPSTVYVPQYNPSVVYGTSMPVYSGYSYAVAPPPPPPVVVGGFATPAVSGLMGFGVGVAVTEVISRPWGWNAWHVHWGEPGQPGNWVRGNRPPPPLARPAVVYNNQTYISNSRTVVENIHNTTHVHVANNAPAAESARPAMTTGVFPGGHGPALAAGAATAAAAAGAYAFSQRQAGDTPKTPSSAGMQPMVRPSAVAPMQPLPDPHVQRAPAAAHQRPGGLTIAQPPAHGQPMQAQQAQTRQQQMAQQRAQQDPMHQQQMAQQHAQQEQARQQQMALQRAQQDPMHQQQMAQQHAQQEQARQQQMAQQRAQQDQMHQQQMAQQHAQQEQARQQQMAQQRAQQDQAHQQQIAQQHAQQEQARQQQMAQQRAQQDQAHQQQIAQQRAQQEQTRQQQMAQQRAQQDQVHQQQMAQQHAQQEQARQQQMAQQRAQQEQRHQQQMAQQHAQAEQMRQPQMQQQSDAHRQPREGQHGERRDRQ